MKLEIELDNLTAEEQETVKRLAEKKKLPYFVPKYEERYYFFGSDGVAHIVTNFEDDVDRWNSSTGNCFRTEKEVEEAKTRLQMQTKWKRLSLEAGEADNPWDGHKSHFYAYWDYVDTRVGYSYHSECKDGLICFPTADSIKAAIAELGEENVKKYILGVEE